jgi:hypothetical protein
MTDDSFEVVNWPLFDTASLVGRHLTVASFIGGILISFFLIVKIYSSVPIRLIPPAVVVKEDPLFRWWTQEWESLTYRVRAILDGDVYDDMDENQISVHHLE